MDCIDFVLRRGKRKIAVVTFAEVGTGNIARKWYEVPDSPVQNSKFWRDVVLALGNAPPAHELVDLRAAFCWPPFPRPRRLSQDAGRQG